jgi:hypothetical protein
MKKTLQAIIGILVLTLAGTSHGQMLTNGTFPLLSTGTNLPPASLPAPVTLNTNKDPVLPSIVFEDVPITTAIENLARIAGINYLIDPYAGKALTGSADSDIPEPIINLRLKNVRGSTALKRILDQHGFNLVENPVTGIARIMQGDRPMNTVDMNLLGLGTNAPVPNTNAIIPEIKFSDVPLDIGLENLIKLCGVSIELDPRLMEHPPGKFVDENGVTFVDPKFKQPTVTYKRWFDPMPVISIHWEDVTAAQAIAALCEGFDLTLTKDRATGVIHIKPREAKRHHHLYRNR